MVYPQCTSVTVNREGQQSTVNWLTINTVDCWSGADWQSTVNREGQQSTVRDDWQSTLLSVDLGGSTVLIIDLPLINSQQCWLLIHPWSTVNCWLLIHPWSTVDCWLSIPPRINSQQCWSSITSLLTVDCWSTPDQQLTVDCQSPPPMLDNPHFLS